MTGFLTDFVTGPPRPFCPGKVPETLPFHSGWFVYLGYELAGEIENRLRLPVAADQMPVALASRCPAALIHDHLEQVTWLTGESDAA